MKNNKNKSGKLKVPYRVDFLNLLYRVLLIWTTITPMNKIRKSCIMA